MLKACAPRRRSTVALFAGGELAPWGLTEDVASMGESQKEAEEEVPEAEEEDQVEDGGRQAYIFLIGCTGAMVVTATMARAFWRASGSGSQEQQAPLLVA
ncbi:unnamed protein product [Polarella glacialis]|uniref:Uncharacterized protein n=1 Tax=Polarella glacialis TaxID=89957 RepID=A0A813HZ30_POLGL|nr:unnamed protein product [Polarella glacialis]